MSLTREIGAAMLFLPLLGGLAWIIISSLIDMGWRDAIYTLALLAAVGAWLATCLWLMS